ncbi:peptidylprolyl isomerase, partial [Candidatus Uhrbacteria bacterium]|nr:peptidylprolyl isomerase [Candidatus Uhrbacteria bacterium]
DVVDRIERVAVNSNNHPLDNITVERIEVRP